MPNTAPCALTGEETETLLPESDTTLSPEGVRRLCESYLEQTE